MPHRNAIGRIRTEMNRRSALRRRMSSSSLGSAPTRARRAMIDSTAERRDVTGRRIHTGRTGRRPPTCVRLPSRQVSRLADRRGNASPGPTEAVRLGDRPRLFRGVARVRWDAPEHGQREHARRRPPPRPRSSPRPASPGRTRRARCPGPPGRAASGSDAATLTAPPRVSRAVTAASAEQSAGSRARSPR